MFSICGEMSKLGDNEFGTESWAGGEVVVVTEEWQRGEEDRRNNWLWDVQSVGKG